jgi:flagellar hook-associated protein 3 FlgL
MRITTGMLHDSTLQGVRQSQARLAKLQSQIAAGRRIQRPSDDAAGIAQVLQTRSALRANTQWSRNLGRARQQVQATESALSAVSDQLADARVLAAQGADAAQSDEALAALATQVNGLIEETLDEANRAADGVHLFGGTDTLTVPFTAARNAAGEITAVTSASAAPAGVAQRLVGEDERLAVNTPSGDVFGDDLSGFGDLIALRDALRAGDRTAVAALSPQLDADLQRVSIAQSMNGVLTQRIDNLETRLGSDATALETARSAAEDIDVTQAVVEYQEEQAVLEAALKMTSQLLELSLAQVMQ